MRSGRSDCTGDGDVAAYAGVPMQKGRESDGIYLPPALLFTLSNVDVDRFYGFKLGRPDEYQAIIDLAAEQGYQVCRWYDFDETSLPGVVNVNNGGLSGWETLDMTRPEDRTIAERMGVQAAVDFANFARKLKMPGMEDCHLVRAGYQTAVRDTRRIVGEYLTSRTRMRSTRRSLRTSCRAGMGLSTRSAIIRRKWFRAMPIPTL